MRLACVMRGCDVLRISFWKAKQAFSSLSHHVKNRHSTIISAATGIVIETIKALLRIAGLSLGSVSVFRTGGAQYLRHARKLIVGSFGTLHYTIPTPRLSLLFPWAWQTDRHLFWKNLSTDIGRRFERRRSEGRKDFEESFQ